MPPLKIFQLNARAYVVSESEVACGHVLDGTQQPASEEDQGDILHRILLNQDILEDGGRAGSFDDMLRERAEDEPGSGASDGDGHTRKLDALGQRKPVLLKQPTIYRKQAQGPPIYEKEPQAEAPRDPQSARSLMQSVRDTGGAMLQAAPAARELSMHDKVKSNSVAFGTVDTLTSNHLYRAPESKAGRNIHDSTSSGLDSSGLQNLGWSAVSYILQAVPDYPLYDRMVIPSAFVGQHIRQCLQERWRCNQQYNKNFRTPTMLARQMLLQGLIHEIKETLPSADGQLKK